MDTPKVFDSEYRFCLILWENEPISSGELVRLCGRQLGWKPTTTYTVIKRLCERGVVKNDNSIVTSLFTKDDIQCAMLDELVQKRFDDSLPSFIAAFARRRQLTQEQLDEIQDMIDSYRKEGSRG